MGTSSDTTITGDTVKRYAIAILLTLTVFGLGYLCGQNTAHAAPSLDKASRLSSPPSRASARPESLQQQRQQRKAALIV
ncbi:hypothetical protein ACO0LF_10380 [Undibacterium sp. Di27W]|uniref:hypothetical protein n=1 Tax=Undibacterium sp. Di27W TaxID=3413036 RepID=UPI003BF0CE99